MGLQVKLKIGQRGDIYEKEADRVADAVLATPTYPAVHQSTPHIQRFADRPSGPAASAPVSVERVLANPGKPLHATLLQDMGQRFGHDFSHVRVHCDEAAERSAREINARAYTVGQDIAFGADQFAPGTHEGRRLIAHELTHVVQQSGASSFSGAPRVLRRAEVAGCRSDLLTYSQIGDEAHDVVQSWCAAQNPPCHAEVPIPGGSRKGTGNFGFADLLVADPPTSNVIEVGEIKPRSQVTSPQAYEQLLGYMEALRAANPTKTVKPMTWIPGPPNGMYPFLEPQQFLGCTPGEMGMYFYQCWRNKKPPRWVPYPIPIPKEVFDQIKGRLKKFVQDIDLGTDGGRQPVPAMRETPAWAMTLLVAAVVVLAILLLPEEIVAAIGAAVIGILRVAAALLGLTSLAWASEGGGGNGQSGGEGGGGGKGSAGKSGAADNGAGGGGAGGTGGTGDKGDTEKGGVGIADKGVVGKGDKGSGGIAWDPLLYALKDPSGTKLTAEDVARIKARLSEIIAKLRKATADDPNAKDVVDVLDQLDQLKGAGQGAGGSQSPPKGKPSTEKKPVSGDVSDTNKAGGAAADKGSRAHGSGGGSGQGGGKPKQSKQNVQSLGRYVSPVPAPADAERQGDITYVYESGLESLLLKNWRAGTIYEVVITASIGGSQVLSRLSFEVDHREGDQIVLVSTNESMLAIQPGGSSAALYISPGSMMRYKPADAPKPPQPQKGRP